MNSKIPNDGFSPVPGEPSASSSQGPPTALLPQETTPEPDFNASVCLRGPCKYLWQVQTNFDHGNTSFELLTLVTNKVWPVIRTWN